MKQARIRSLLLLPLLILLLLCATAFPVGAATPKATLTGTSTLRAGDSLTVSFYLDGDGIQAMQGTLEYDKSKLTYSSAKASVKGWDITFSEESEKIGFIGIEEGLSGSLDSRTKMMTFTFKVKSNLAAGTSIRLKATDLSASDGTNDFTISDASYSVKLAAPKSDDCTLSALRAEEASLTPDFEPDVTEYTAATVPFDVSALTLTATPSDSAATVKISGNELVVGENTISILVTAENGDTLTYKIRIEREQDPNYIPSSDGTLAEITLSAGMLSPTFDPAILDYLVVLPYEITELHAVGVAQHPLAIGGAEATIPLNEGENHLTLLNRAEDGSEHPYHITVIRLPRYEGLPPTVTPGTEPPPETAPPPPETIPPETQPPVTQESKPIETDPPTVTETDPIAQTTKPENDQTETKDSAPAPDPASPLAYLNDKVILLSLAATAAVMLGVGLIIGALVARPKKYKYRPKYRKP